MPGSLTDCDRDVVTAFIRKFNQPHHCRARSDAILPDAGAEPNAITCSVSSMLALAIAVTIAASGGMRLKIRRRAVRGNSHDCECT